MLNCKICGSTFPALRQGHYVSRGDSETGLNTIFKASEAPLYDTFDCPMCGCQVIAQSRKRAILPNDNDDAPNVRFTPAEDTDRGKQDE